MVIRNHWLGALMGLVLAVLLAGCSGEDPTGPQAAGADDNNMAALTETEVVTGGAAGELAEVPLGAGDSSAAPDPAAEPPSDLESQWLTSGRAVGRPVVTPEGEQIGDVVDLLISPQGETLYMVFDAGPAMGLDETHLVAVGWDRVSVGEQERPVTPESGDGEVTRQMHVFVVEPDDLEDEPVVDPELFADGALFVEAAGLEIDTDAVELIRASRFGEFDLTNYRLVNDAGEELGDVEELIINLVDGRVVYVVSNIGGVMGVGETTLAIPWGTLTYHKELETFTLPVGDATLDEAPAIELDDLKVQRFPEGWDDEIAGFWSEVELNGNGE